MFTHHSIAPGLNDSNIQNYGHNKSQYADKQETHKKISHAYEPNHNDYLRIKNWISQANLRYFPQSDLVKDDDTGISNYVISFRIISLDDRFVSKHYRIIKNVAAKGLMLMANIYDQAKKIYITESLQRKQIGCVFQEQTNSIKLQNSFTLAFYISHPPNIIKFGLSFFLNVQIVSTDGQIFELGTISHSLENRPRHAILPYELKGNFYKGNQSRNKQNVTDRIGLINAIIDCPQPKLLQLEGLIPAFRIICEQKQIILPPCNKISLLNKVSPLTISQNSYYPINLYNLSIKIKDYGFLTQAIKKCSPFFIDFHYENLTVEILEFKAILGYHNTWKFVGELKGLLPIQDKNIKSKSKSKDKAKVQKNKDVKSSELYKSDSDKLSNIIKLNATTQLTNSTKQLTLETTTKNPILLHYFHNIGGHLALVLQAKIKYTLDLTIKQSNVKQLNLGWIPIVFTLDQPMTTVELELINDKKIRLPGYEVEIRNNIDTHFLSDIKINASYEIKNNNQELYNIARKQSQKTIMFGSMKSLSSVKDIGAHQAIKDSYIKKLADDLSEKSEQSQAFKISDAAHKKSSKISNILEGIDLPQISKLQQINILLNALNKRMKKRMVPEGLEIPIPTDETSNFPSKSQLINRQIKLRLKFYGILPHTTASNIGHNDSVPINLQYYIPAKLLIQVFIMRERFIFIAQLPPQKNYVKYCVPLQLNCSKTIQQNEYNSIFSNATLHACINNFTQLEVTFNVSSEQVYNEVQEALIICQVYDLQNYLLYAQGQYPFICLLDSICDHKSSLKSLTSKRNYTYGQDQSCQEINLNINSKQSQSDHKLNTILSKKVMDTIFQGITDHQKNMRHEDSMKNIKIELFPPQADSQVNTTYGRDNSLIFGSLLFSVDLEVSKPENVAQAHVVAKKPQPFLLQNSLKNLTTKQRQLLRISNFNHGVTKIDHHQLIEQVRQKEHQNYVKQVINQQYHNDITLQYQTGVPVYHWLDFINTDTSGNDMFTFATKCQFLQIVTDQREYEKVVKVRKELKPSQDYKNPNMTYRYTQQHEYQGRIMMGKQYKLLLRVSHQGWQYNTKKIQIIKLKVRRNKQPYCEYKIRLNYNPPLISGISHFYYMMGESRLANTRQETKGIHVKIPQYLIKKYSNNIKALNEGTSVSKKDKSIFIEEVLLYKQQSKQQNLANLFQEEENSYLFEKGRIIDILLGFYWDQEHLNIMKTVIIRVELMYGQSMAMQLGQTLNLNIPFYREGLKESEKVYRIETSVAHRKCFRQISQYRLLAQDGNILDSNTQPYIKVCPLKPIFQQKIALSIINTDGRLMKKYLLNLTCKLPKICQFQQIKMNGIKGEKTVIVLKNPYKIPFGFYLRCTSPQLISFHELGGLKNYEQLCDNKEPLKIPVNSQIKLIAQLKFSLYAPPKRLLGHLNQEKNDHNNDYDEDAQESEKVREQYVVITDLNNHITGIYKFIIMSNNHKSPPISIHENEKFTLQARDHLISLFGPQINEKTI